MNQREGACAHLGSARLTLFFLFVILGLFVVATIIPQDPTTGVPLESLYSPEAVYFLRLSGLADIFHSDWFIFVLVALAVNLISAAVNRLPGVWKQITHRLPPALNVDQVTRGHHGHKGEAAKDTPTEGYLHAEIRSAIAREEFRELVKDWARHRIGTPLALRDEGGLNELQLAVQRGRFSRVAAYAASLGLVLAVTGLFIDEKGDFQGEMTVESGARAKFLHVTRGSPQAWTPRWKVLEENGRPQPGYFIPGFEVGCTGIDVENYRQSDVPQVIESHLEFYEQGHLVSSQLISPERPGWYHGLAFYQGDVTRGGAFGATLVATDAETHEQKKIENVTKGASFDLGDYRIKLLDMQTTPGPEGYGPSVQLEYEENHGAPEKFWLFRSFPDFDAVHRKKSRVHFALTSLATEPVTVLRVSKEPGAPWVLAGLFIGLLGLGYSLIFGLNRYWFAWFPGRVAIVGWSHRLGLFEPRFERAVSQLRARIMRVEKYRAGAKSDASA